MHFPFAWRSILNFVWQWIACKHPRNSNLNVKSWGPQFHQVSQFVFARLSTIIQHRTRFNPLKGPPKVLLPAVCQFFLLLMLHSDVDHLSWGSNYWPIPSAHAVDRMMHETFWWICAKSNVSLNSHALGHGWESIVKCSFTVGALKGSRTWLNEFARSNAAVVLHDTESVARAVGLEFVSFGCGTQMQWFFFCFFCTKHRLKWDIYTNDSGTTVGEPWEMRFRLRGLKLVLSNW